ncbi:23S rRNA (guanosine(2251)-2'-O)-methyltransferase RlmB [Asticcacaulis tiandongensis]|uniref:23S rRNA (guanosine(2251)-2'-O)-methyltransferase RlmB n=1 Tax=Asticcacaulis tiandongensis TaxID=2565365 RepID=UPI001FE26E11|nr:23S rRNA (guanosine(2251)-2'-O)-methyltransferase RlmB [Asticcacaulis tiandongensis]
MAIKRERNDPAARNTQNFGKKSQFQGKSRQAPPPKGNEGREKPQSFHKPKVSEEGWVWGLHAVEAGLKNMSRKGPIRLYLTEDRQKSLPQTLLKRSDLHMRVTPMAEFNAFLPQGAVHQGIAFNAPPLEGTDIDSLMEAALSRDVPVLVMLDQVTDPQNVGAIFRTCAAFGASGLIMQDRHSPVMQGVLAKTAAGAVDVVPFAKVTNLSRALERLAEAGFVSLGLAGEAEGTLQEVLETQGWRKSAGPRGLVLVMGSEGEGLRRLVAEHCDHLVKIPMPGGFESLNVSHATSISLYEALGRNY